MLAAVVEGRVCKGGRRCGAQVGNFKFKGVVRLRPEGVNSHRTQFRPRQEIFCFVRFQSLTRDLGCAGIISGILIRSDSVKGVAVSIAS